MAPTSDDEKSQKDFDAFWASPAGGELVRALGSESAWVEPSSDLERRVLDGLATEATGPARTTDAGQGAVVDLISRRRSRLGALAPWVAAAAAVLVAVSLTLSAGRMGPAGQYTAVLAGTDLAPTATARATLQKKPSGLEIHLEVTGLPLAPAGSYYQAWMKGERGLVAIGTFHTGGSIVLWSGVDVKDYPAMTITAEPDDGVQTSSGQRLLAGAISAR